MSKRPISFRPLPPPKVEIINLIDVLITLIAFFMLTTVFAERQRRLDLELPVVQSSEKSAETFKDSFLLLELDHNGVLSYNGSQVLAQELPALLQQEERETPVLLRADRDCRYEEVIQIIDLLKESGLIQLALEVKEDPMRDPDPTPLQ